MEENTNSRAGYGSDPERQPSSPDADFRIVAEEAPVTLWLTNSEGEGAVTNSKRTKLVGSSAGERVGGDAWMKAPHPDELDPCQKIFEEACEAHKSLDMEYRRRRADGQYRCVLDKGEPCISKDGKFAGFIGACIDIADRKNHENQLRVSQTELTQHNLEMQLINELNSCLQACRSLEETRSIVAHFSRRILADCAGALYLFDEYHRRVESVARWSDAECFSGEAISHEEHDCVCKGKNLAQVAVSMGVAEFPAGGDSVLCVLEAADTGLYQAKESGRNRVTAAGNCAPQMHSTMNEPRQLGR